MSVRVKTNARLSRGTRFRKANGAHLLRAKMDPSDSGSCPSVSYHEVLSKVQGSNDYVPSDQGKLKMRR